MQVVGDGLRGHVGVDAGAVEESHLIAQAASGHAVELDAEVEARGERWCHGIEGVGHYHALRQRVRQPRHQCLAEGGEVCV